MRCCPELVVEALTVVVVRVREGRLRMAVARGWEWEGWPSAPAMHRRCGRGRVGAHAMH